MQLFTDPLAAWQAREQRGGKDIWFHNWTRMVCFGDRENLRGSREGWRELTESELAGLSHNEHARRELHKIRAASPMRGKVEQEDVAGLELFQSELKV